MIVSEKNKSVYEKLAVVWMSALVISQVLFPKFVTIWIVFGILHTIFGIVISQRKFLFSWISVGFASLYLFYLVGMLFSKNIPLGLSYLENKLSFLVFALIFSFPPQKIRWIPVSISFILSVLFAILLGFLNGWSTAQHFPELGNVVSFTGAYFSYIHHPTYFAVYILVAIMLLLKLKESYFSTKLKPVIWLVLILFLVAYVVTISLAAYLFLTGILAILAVRFILLKVPKPFAWLLTIVLPFVMYLVIWSIPTIQVQLKNSYTYFTTYLEDPQGFINSKNGFISGDETRIIMWTVAGEEFYANPFGVGTGSVDLHLSNRLKSHGLFEIAALDEKNTIIYNPHNQYLQLGLEIGIIGLILFLSLLTYLIRKAYIEKNWILFILVLSLAFNSLFESMLQRQSGIVFFTFFIFLIAEIKANKDEISFINKK